MKRNLALLLIMTSATLAQTPGMAGKPATKPSAATVKAVPQATVKAQPNAVKVSASPVSKPATVSVQAAPAKPAVAVPAKPVAVVASPAKTGAAIPKSNSSGPATVSVKPAAVPAKVAVVNPKAPQVPTKKAAEVKVPATKEAAKAAHGKGSAKPQATVAVKDSKATVSDKKQASKTINAVGRRDPFVSPVVKLGAVGSGCSSGKRCLAIDQIALKGVVKSDVGMIAVVVNAMDKAYFLRENDPVFNGYVVKITGDSIVFKETFHDRLGKSLTRDVTKTIRRPAV
jgi:hypothetical protein